MEEQPGRSLKIVHVFRAPLGGLFRHVADLTREQAARGHQIGIIADSTTGGARADEVLAELAPCLTLGVSRMPMHRQAHPGDALALARIMRRLKEIDPDVVHGHGAKGGAYARLPALLGARTPVRAYTPHGGSFNYQPGTSIHTVYMAIERTLAPATDLLLFESAYIGARYAEQVGPSNALHHVIVNGVSKAELAPVEPAPDAADLLYVGELRSAKGIDTLLDALPIVRSATGIAPTLVLVGSAPDEAMLTARAATLGLQGQVRFAGAMPARQAFRLGRALVVPSRAESLPYVVLEAAGASIPMIATNVGGIPEIFGPYAHRLIDCDKSAILAYSIGRMLTRPAAQRLAEASELAAFVGEKFTLDNMANGVLAGYREALARKQLTPSTPGRPAASHGQARG